MGNYTPPAWTPQAPAPTPSGYFPPTEVVQSDSPYLSLVTQVDPSWANLKYREVQYEFDGRTIRYNPYWTAAYSGLSNLYRVGSQWGGLDPNFVPLSSSNIGAAALTNAQSISLTLTAPIAAGSLIALFIADSSMTAPIAGENVSDNAGSEYETLFSPLIAQKGAPVAVVFAFAAAALAQGSSITYTSPGTPSSSNALAIIGIAVAGGVQPSAFDADVTAQLFGTSSAPTVTSGEPAQQSEAFIGFAIAASDGTFVADATHGWNSLQQAAAGSGAGQISLCSSTQSGALFDPGTNASVIFAPQLSGSAAWSAFVLGVLPTKPMFSGTDDGQGWG